ncbi:MAG: monovalent cation/H(+) antiporter subunit G [Candidatus Hydrothermarchaeales archaeon]
MIDIVVLALLLMGVFFFVIGTIGLLRFPDVYTRMHATTKCDTLGAISIFLGLAIYSGLSFTSFKILLIIVFIVWVNPTTAHAIAKAAYVSGVELWEGSVVDEYKGVKR